MKRFSFPIASLLALSVLFCCKGDEEKARERVLKAAEKYVSLQLSNPETRILQDSTIMIGDTTKRYFIQPSQVFSGYIDDNSTSDGIVSATSMERNGRILNEHLIILDIDNKLQVVRSIESDMKIISVKDGVITADVPTHPVNNPLHDCPVCREVKKYKFMKGDLIEMN